MTEEDADEDKLDVPKRQHKNDAGNKSIVDKKKRQ